MADALDPLTRTLLTEIDVPNPDGALPSGVYCSVELHIPRKIPSLVVSADAIIFDAQGLRVAVIQNDVVHMRKVTIARNFGTQVEVSDGLKDGDQVILNPSVNLADGSKVQAQPSRRHHPPTKRNDPARVLARGRRSSMILTISPRNKPQLLRLSSLHMEQGIFSRKERNPRTANALLAARSSRGRDACP